MRTALRFFRVLPARLELEYLRWALREIDLQHPDLPEIVLRIRDLQRGTR